MTRHSVELRLNTIHMNSLQASRFIELWDRSHEITTAKKGIGLSIEYGLRGELGAQCKEKMWPCMTKVVCTWEDFLVGSPMGLILIIYVNPHSK